MNCLGLFINSDIEEEAQPAKKKPNQPVPAAPTASCTDDDRESRSEYCPFLAELQFARCRVPNVSVLQKSKNQQQNQIVPSCQCGAPEGGDACCDEGYCGSGSDPGGGHGSSRPGPQGGDILQT
jgi:hypothetical protein